MMMMMLLLLLLLPMIDFFRCLCGCLGVCVCVCAVSVNCPNTVELDSARLAFNNIYALGLCAKSTGHTIPIKLKHSTTASAQTHTHTHKYTPIHTHTHTSTDKHIHSASAFFSYNSCEKFAEFAEFCLKFARAEAVAYESRVRRGKSLENNMKSALSACLGALKEANKFYEISYFHNSKANFFEPRIFFALQSSQGKCL